MKHRWLPWVVLLVVLCGCKNMGRQPSSIKPSEVVVADSTGLLSRLLEVPCEGLPQTEPMFDVISLQAAEPQGLYRQARCVVIRCKGQPLHIVYNRWTEGQMVVYTDGSQDTLLRRTLLRFQTMCRVSALKQKHNVAATKSIGNLMGISVWLPADFRPAVQTPSFVWYNADAERSIRNVCLMTLSDTTQLTTHVDSVLRRHVKGATDAMYVQMVKHSLHHYRQADGSLWLRGQWQMEGDAMGGPFVLRLVQHRHRWMAAMGFIYAPGMKKRDLMGEMEGVLHTIKQENNNHHN